MAEVLYPMRSADMHSAAANGGGGGAGGDRNSIAGSVASGQAAVTNGGGSSGSLSIGQNWLHTDFPPKEYGNAAAGECT